MLDLGVAGASVSGGSVVGALAGQNQGTIRRSWSSTGPSEKIQGNWSNVGGLVGVNRGNIAASRSAADVSITRNHANVSIGGLVGQNFGRIVAGDAFGAVAGGTAGNYGGLAGYNNGGSVAASYAAGAVTGTGNKGGLVGDSAGTATVSASYWDTATTGIADDIDTAAPEGRTTAELQSPTGYSGIYADWNADLGEGDDDFADGDKDDPWHFGGADDYPRLNGLPRLDAGGHAVSGVSLTATLTLSNWGGDWWYKADKAPHASCSSKVAAGTGTASLSGLKATDSYAYAAYMDSGCALMLAAAPVSGASAVTLDATGVTEASARLSISASYSGQWWYKGSQATATCTSVADGVRSVDLSSLESGATLTYRAYGKSGCASADELGSVDFSTPELEASAVAETSATLTLANHSGPWWYKGTETNAACKSVESGTAASLSDLAGGESHSYAAYARAGCASVARIARVTFNTLRDYDADGDGLVEIATLEQLNAVRWDLDGDGDPASGRATDYAAAFPDAVSTPGNLGCPAAHCAGYELAASLDFASASSYASGTVNADWSAGANDSGGWTPLGGATDKFRGEFDGNGRAVANLYIDRSGSDDQGLFGVVGAAGEVLDLGVVGASVRGGARVGALAGDNEGAVRHCWSGTGSGEKIVATKASAGGLVGRNKGTVAASRSTAAVDLESSDRATHAGNAGGLVGETSGASAKVAASWAGGAVDNDDDVSGGLVGLHGGGSVSASHAIGPVTLTNGTAKGGLVGSAGVGATVAASYWDALTTGVPDDADNLAPEGRKTSELTAPTGYSGPYASWNVDVDGVTGVDDPWHFRRDRGLPAPQAPAAAGRRRLRRVRRQGDGDAVAVELGRGLAVQGGQGAGRGVVLAGGGGRDRRGRPVRAGVRRVVRVPGVSGRRLRGGGGVDHGRGAGPGRGGFHLDGRDADAAELERGLVVQGGRGAGRELLPEGGGGDQPGAPLGADAGRDLQVFGVRRGGVRRRGPDRGRGLVRDAEPGRLGGPAGAGDAHAVELGRGLVVQGVGVAGDGVRFRRRRRVGDLQGGGEGDILGDAVESGGGQDLRDGRVLGRRLRDQAGERVVRDAEADGERGGGDDGDADHRQPQGELALQIHGADDAGRNLLRGGGRNVGEPGEPGHRHDLHVQGVRRRRLRGFAGHRRRLHDQAGQGGGRRGRGPRRGAVRGLDGRDGRDVVQDPVEVGGADVGRGHPAGHLDRRLGDALAPGERHGLHGAGGGDDLRRRRRVVGRGHRHPGGRDADRLRDRLDRGDAHHRQLRRRVVLQAHDAGDRSGRVVLGDGGVGGGRTRRRCRACPRTPPTCSRRTRTAAARRSWRRRRRSRR